MGEKLNFVPVVQMAKRVGQSPRHLQRIAAKLVEEGLAKKMRIGPGRKAQWVLWDGYKPAAILREQSDKALFTLPGVQISLHRGVCVTVEVVEEGIRIDVQPGRRRMVSMENRGLEKQASKPV